MGDETAEIPSYHAMPCCAFARIELITVSDGRLIKGWTNFSLDELGNVLGVFVSGGMDVDKGMKPTFSMWYFSIASIAGTLAATPS